jgi:hypothetical protein
MRLAPSQEVEENVGVKLPRGLRVRLERFTGMAIVLGAAQDASS